MNCTNCGEPMRITDPDDFALTRLPYMVEDPVDFCSDQCWHEYNGDPIRDTLVDLNPAACTLAAERAGEL